jgi:hypothetical protein
VTEREQIGDFAKTFAETGDRTVLGGLSDYLEENSHPVAGLVRRAFEDEGGKRVREDIWNSIRSRYNYPGLGHRTEPLWIVGQNRFDVFDRKPRGCVTLHYYPLEDGRHSVELRFLRDANTGSIGDNKVIRKFFPVTHPEAEALAGAIHNYEQSPQSEAFLDHVRETGKLIPKPEPDRYAREVDRILPSYFDSGPVLFPDRRVLIKPVA